jgi:acyl-CoA reductase-like NAD-dependent aldehyde dehydrogenase
VSEYKLLIAGQLVAGDRESGVIDPSTGDVFAQCPRASDAQLEQAVAAAKAAFPAWAATPEQERRDALAAIAAVVEQHAAELAPILVREHGMPMRNAMLELMVFGMKLKGTAMQPISVKAIEVGPGRRVEQRYLPLGVVAAIVPWNVPLILFANKLAPALLLGNTLVVKPAPTTSLTTLRIGELMADLLPPGVVNIIADENDLGGRLAAHPDVRMVAFTGSTATGRKVAAAGAETIKRHILELGGNDPAIVFDDADVDDAAEKIFRQSMIVSGQACVAIKRVYAQAGVHDALCTALGKRFGAVRMGNGFVEGIEFGPLQNNAQFERVSELLADATSNGRIVAQGQVPDGAGYFVPATLIADVSNGSRIVDEEQFGPILPVVRFETEDEAVRLANEGPYGLAASVFTADPDCATRVVNQLDAGTVTVNKVLEMHPFVPFGGAKQSGVGVENTELGLAEFAQLQIVDVAT